VTRVHRAPTSGADPDGYLAAVIEIAKTDHIDALIPVHEQAYLFAAARTQLPAGLGIALADFEAFEQVQSKAGFASLLTRLKVPQPSTEVIRSADEFAAERPYPFFVKGRLRHCERRRPGGSATSTSAMRCSFKLEALDAFAHGLLVQAAVTGALERTQAVFDRGRRVASHIYRQVVEGPGGGDILEDQRRQRRGSRHTSKRSDKRLGGTARCRSTTSWMTQPTRRISSTPIPASSSR